MCKEYANEELLNNEECVNIQTGGTLDLVRVSQLKDNAMLKAKTELWIEWDFEKNNKLGRDIWKMTKGINGYKVWWICTKCMSSFDMNINNRFHNNNCPFCNGKKTNNTNSLASLNPTLASQWHPTLNGELTPHDVTCNSNIKVWWICDLGHEWDTIIASRNKGNGCLYCCNQKVLKGFNDMWTTNPDLAKLLHNHEDGYKYTKTSHTKLDWKCPNCNNTIRDKDIRAVSLNGIACPECSDGIYYPEKVVYYVLKNIGIDFTWQKTFGWSHNKRFDFFTNDHNSCIIEVHGGQHSIDRGFERSGGKTIEEEQENDQYKYELAMKNGIKNYVVIDARYSDFEYIKNNIITSMLPILYNYAKIDWNWIYFKSQSSMVFEVCKLWNSGVMNIKEIGNELKIGKGKVTKLLKIGNSLNICEYSPKKWNNTPRKIAKLTLNDMFIESYESISSAVSSNNSLSRNGITKCCTGKQNKAFGCKWMYLEDYEKMVKEQSKTS